MAYCSNCGKEISDGIRFCPSCGTEIKVPVVVTTPITPGVNNVNAEVFTVPVPEKKKTKNAIIVVVAVVVIGIVALLVNYFTGDGYRYNKAIDMLKSGQYEEAFAIFDSLGDYKDAANYLPFNGKYVDVAVGDERYYNFLKNGEYTETIPGSDGDSVYEGTYETDGYDKATLTEDDGDVDGVFLVFENYIYESENEDFVFDEEIDISKGYFNGETKEICSFDLDVGSTKVTTYFTWEYSFEDDGTYKLRRRLYNDDIDDPISDDIETGTYEINGSILTVTPNEKDENVKSFLVIDSKMYRSVYVREYDVD